MRWFILFLCFLFSACSGHQKDALYVFSWAEFFNPELIIAFEKKYDCRVVIDTYDSNESLYAKLNLGAARYDLILPSGYYLELLKQQTMIRPIDPSCIPNLASLDPSYHQLSPKMWGVPFVVSFSAVAYRKDHIDPEQLTWGVFNNKAFKGRMTLLNDIREAIGAALIHLGYSLNSTNPKELTKAGELLMKWKQNLAKFDSEQYKNGLATGEFLVVQAFSNDIALLMQEEDGIDFFYPEKGASMSIDYFAIPKGAKNLKLAYAFINFFLEPKHAAKNMLYNPALIPLKNIDQYLEPTLKKNRALFPSPEQRKNMQLIEDVGESIQLYYEIWEKVKAG